MTDDVSIDRLVLDIPGLNAEQAARVARRVGERLAGASGSFDTLSVTVEDGDPERLADRIVAALLRRIG
jgi:hypothetical protein